jgi:hypothetical protein
MLTAPPEKIGRFEKLSTPNGDVVYKERRGDNHYYHAEVKESRTAKGGYSYVKGSTLTGVSTAAKFLDGDPTGLMHWSAKMDQQGIARIASADLDAGRSLDWLRSQETVSERLRAEEATWEHERDRRADQGTNIHHHTVWKLATGEGADLRDLSEAERGFGQAVFASFLALDLHDKVTYAEQLTVAHDKRMAGTFDLLADEVEVALLMEHLVNPEDVPADLADARTLRLLADYKTRDDAGKVRLSDFVQLVGYEDCNRQCGIGASDGRLVIVVLPDGSFEIYWGTATMADWAAAVNACHSGRPIRSQISALCKKAKTAREAVVV